MQISSTTNNNDPKLQARQTEEKNFERAKEDKSKEDALAQQRAQEAAKITGMGQSLNITV